MTKLTDAGSSGSFIWSLWAGASEQGTVTATDVAATGSSVYLAGRYDGTTTTFGNTTLTNNGLVGTMNALVAKVIDAGSTGSFIWTQQGGGMADDDASAIAISGATIYVAGSAGMMARFGSQTLLDIPGNSQVAYLARLTEQPLAVGAPKRAVLGIYPNPARTLARVVIPSGIAVVQLQDVLGHVLQNVPVKPNTPEAVLSLDGLPTGVYLVRVGASTGKLLVE
ncbi:T9SS type A sorting domain-containing protein [Hymenobacter defluvii]|uniref:T9SS type A sorting domain-containing protein n=1 Tax=Hymenobacter defluvii TaxID=2054411 RepID=A0ABS3TF95_9BACT|nr:T9SS type A sorting domain-containing protein [Hymenobacter defluvii]